MYDQISTPTPSEPAALSGAGVLAERTALQGAGVSSLPASFTALARSEVYLYLARAFSYPGESLAGRHRRASAALAALGARPTLRIARPPDLPTLEHAYQTTFTHTTAMEYPPYETQYSQGTIFRQSHALAELAALYRAFGLQPASGERLDHVGTELEFLYFLCYKQAFALFGGNEDGAQRCAEGQRLFLEQHLGCWAPLFLERLARQPDGFYAGLASLAGAWLALDAARLGTRLAPLGDGDVLAARRAEQFFDGLDDTPAACEVDT